MPISIADSGTQTATLATDHTLSTTTAPTGGAIYQLRVDAVNLVNGERLILRLDTELATGGTVRALYSAVFEHAQGDTIKDSPAVAVPAGADIVATLRQENGTGRAFDWALYRLDG